MKMPNGYGSIIKLSGKRRRPFAVRITSGYTDEGKQKFVYLSYHEKREHAIIALADYNKNPFDVTKANTTFAEIYEAMMKEKFPDGPSEKSRSNFLGYQASYRSAEKIHHLKFVDLRKKELQQVVDACKKSHGTKRKIKVLFNQMYKYAMQNDLVSKDYSDFVDLGKKDSGTYRKPFNMDEIKMLWSNEERDNFIKLILILIYTAMRPGELLDVKTADVNLGERYLLGGFKTDAETNRVIPIHKSIHRFIEELVSNNQDYLVTTKEMQQMKYRNFYNEHFKRVMKQLSMEHKPYDCRHTFATLMIM